MVIAERNLEGLTKMEARFVERTPVSRRMFDESRDVIPGGTPGGLAFQRPYPLTIDRGSGCHVWDVDGHRMLDLMGGDWLQPLGHAHPAVIAAVTDQMHRGTTFAAPGRGLAMKMADLVRHRIPSIDRLRFTTSGTEATMAALRLARVHTGRTKVAKMRGGYHGTHDMSLIANYRTDDPDLIPPGLIPGTSDSTVVLPFNQPERALATIAREHADLAAVIVEPMLGGSGMVPATAEFLGALREVTRRHGIVLIFDEVVTGALGQHGAQGLYGIDPDLTTLGKAIGGGLPLGVFGGRRDIMNDLDPLIPGAGMRHATTLGGIPVTLAAGIAQLELMDATLHSHLDAVGDRLRSAVVELGHRRAWPLQATGLGQYFCVHWTSVPVVDFDTALTSDRMLTSQIVIGLENEGFLLFYSNCAGLLSGPMTSDDVDGFVAALEGVVAEVVGE